MRYAPKDVDMRASLIAFQAFNEELDGMYNDINLPDDEAWVAMSEDLRTTKEARNALSKENS